jgi:hypothetical protein
MSRFRLEESRLSPQCARQFVCVIALTVCAGSMLLAQPQRGAGQPAKPPPMDLMATGFVIRGEVELMPTHSEKEEMVWRISPPEADTSLVILKAEFDRAVPVPKIFASEADNLTTTMFRLLLRQASKGLYATVRFAPVSPDVPPGAELAPDLLDIATCVIEAKAAPNYALTCVDTRNGERPTKSAFVAVVSVIAATDRGLSQYLSSNKLTLLRVER